MNEHKCTECKYEYGSWGCSRAIVVNRYTGVESNTLDREANKEGNCGYFEEIRAGK